VNEGVRPERNERERGQVVLFVRKFSKGRNGGRKKGRGRKERTKKGAEGKERTFHRSLSFAYMQSRAGRSKTGGPFFQERFFSRRTGENLSSERTRRGKKLFCANFLNFVFSSKSARFLLNTGNKLPISIYYGYIGLFFKVKAEKNDSL
jgi:hypothetical protein